MAVLNLRAVIVGSGPAGFYSAEQLLAAGFEVDLIDALPTPFGLVRSGVAPDHPKIKSVTRVFEKAARHDGFRFFGGICLGRDVSRRDLLHRYHVVVYATGTADAKPLAIPGEDRPGSHSATDFVAWYNGHPHAADAQFDLNVDRAVVIGNGNVAIDVARMLMLGPEELAPTDAADHAITALAGSRVKEVVLLGRRGPAQAAFTPPELRELGELQRAGVVVDAADLELDELSESWLTDEADSTARRNMALLEAYSRAAPRQATHRLVLRFLRSPLEICGAGEHGRVHSLRVAVNRIEHAGEGGGLQAVRTQREETIGCGLVLRAVGYRGRAVEDLPFDAHRGVIVNSGGRILSTDGTPCSGEYAVGWIKRGPSGVIGTNKKDATETVAKILHDRTDEQLNTPAIATREESASWLCSLSDDVVSWDGWRAIDDHEMAAGASQGRPRVKLVALEELHKARRLASARSR